MYCKYVVWSKAKEIFFKFESSKCYFFWPLKDVCLDLNQPWRKPIFMKDKTLSSES